MKRRRRQSDVFVDYFWARVDRSGGIDTCWPWTGAIGGDGYGEIQSAISGRVEKTHRIVWTLINGHVSSDVWVSHTCRNKVCCNPAHLYLSTRREILVDASRWQRANGGRRPRVKLTDNAVQEIRRLDAEGQLTQTEIGDRFGIVRQTVANIVGRKTPAWLAR